MSASLHALRALLQHRDFARYAAARFLATLSWQMLSVAVGWQTYAVTGDPMALGLVGLVQFVPFLLLVIPAGQIADLADRRLVLIGAYACEAASGLLLLAYTWRGMTVSWPIYVAMGLFGAGRAFWMPTGQAMTPNLVPPEVFPRAIALNSTLYQTAAVCGPAIGGFLYLLGADVVYGCAAGLLFVSTILILAMAPVKARSSGPWQLADTLDGLRFVLKQRIVLGAISLDLFAVLFGGATALLPIFAADVLHIGPAGLGILRTAPGVGAVVMAAFLAWHPLTRHVGRWMFTGVTIFGGATLVFGSSTNFWLSLVALVALGAGDMVSIYVRHMLVQLETPDAIRGRVSAVNSIFIGSSNELGEFESGATAKWFGLVPSVIFGGCMTLLVVAAFMRLFPELRTMNAFPRARRDGS